MLVLSRKKEESIVIDGNIEVQILKVKGNTVRLGIKAPHHIKVLRGELSPFDVDATLEGESSDPQESDTSGMIIRDIVLPNAFSVAQAS